MGGGSYSYINSRTRADVLNSAAAGMSLSDFAKLDCSSKSTYAAANSRSIAQSEFKRRSLDPEMNILGKIRESRDSEEHPTSFPIIIGLDVTGSMSTIPAELVADAFPEIMKSVMDAGVEHAQVCFVGIGDDVYDTAPIQVGQFETSDELTEKWLKKLYLEGGGGGNYGESYTLAWYFAAHHTSIDSYEKRGKKGCLITIGDEPFLSKTSRHTISSLFGDNVQSDLSAKGLLNDASEKWDIYHIDAGNNEHIWKELSGLKYQKSGRTVNSISVEIIKCILSSYKGSTQEPEVKEEESIEKEDIIL